MSYIGTQPNNVKQNIGLYTPNDITALTKDGHWGGSLELIESQIYSSGTVSAVDFTSIKGAKFDVHFLTWSNVDFASEEVPALRFRESGTWETASVYQYAYQGYSAGGSFTENRSTGETYCLLGNYTNDNTNGYAYIYNAIDSTKYTFGTFQMVVKQDIHTPRMAFGSNAHMSTSACSGLRVFLATTGNIAEGNISLYGQKVY